MVWLGSGKRDLRFEFEFRDSDFLWFNVLICSGETECTQQSFLRVWTVWLCDGVQKALNSFIVSFSWGRVVYSSAETELLSVDLNVSLYRSTAQHKRPSKTHLTHLTMPVLLINTRGGQRSDFREAHSIYRRSHSLFQWLSSPFHLSSVYPREKRCFV